MKNAKITILLAGMLVLVFANFFVWEQVLGLGGGVEVLFFDVGQGDGMRIETPEGHQIVIDGGPSGSRMLEKVGQEMPFYDRKLDLLVLSHPDYDHLAGLIDVLDRYKVENILWTGVLRETKTFEKWLEKIEQEEANIFIAKRGQVIKAGESIFYVFHPFESLEGELMEKGSNESSIVLKMVFGENSFLFTGDISAEQEGDLLVRSDSPVSLYADVIKSAHHGSKTANSRGFFEILQPQAVVISCGKDNSYGHPHEQVLQTFQEFGIKVLRTDLLGDIKIIADGINLIF